MIKKQLQELILQNKFSNASKLVTGATSTEELEGILLEIAYDTESLLVYEFVNFLIEQKESVELHSIAASLLNNPLCFIDGAYAKGLNHVRRAMDFVPMDVSLKELILFYSLVPDEIVTREEAREYAMQILQIDPNNKVALDFLSNEL